MRYRRIIVACSRRTAFTLIEMIVAIALSAMLLLLVSVISRQALRSQAFAAQTAASVSRNEWLIDQFQRDVAHAEQIAIQSDGFWLSGSLQRDPILLMANQRMATVRYRVARLTLDATSESMTTNSPGNLWLVREQMSGGGRDISVEPIWRGVARIMVTSDTIDALPEMDELELAVEESLDGVGNGSKRRLPETVTVTLIDQRGHTVMSQRFRHHWEGE